MIKSIINPSNFDIEFRKISRNKRGIAKSRVDFENIDVEAKNYINYVSNFKSEPLR